MKKLYILMAAGLAALALAACSTGGDGDTTEPTAAPTSPPAAAAAPTPSETPEPAAEPTVRPDMTKLNYGPKSAEGLQAILGTGDLGVGANRFGFVMTSQTGFVTEPTTELSTRFVADGGEESEVVQQATAHFQPWPYGNRGLYAADLDFDRAGTWRVEIEVVQDGDPAVAELVFEVGESTSAPDVGDPAVRSVTKTLEDVGSLAELSTGSKQDEDLYQTTLAAAVDSGMPTVVVFASPAFCTNAVCGPQVEVLKELKELYKEQANFVHVDFYENPHEIQGDLDRARISPAVTEWSLPSIEWTFVIDGEGTVTARFEGFATLSEVEAALKPLL